MSSACGDALMIDPREEQEEEEAARGEGGGS